MNYFAYPSMFGLAGGRGRALGLAGGWLRRRRLKVLEILGQPSTIRRMIPAGLAAPPALGADLQIAGTFVFCGGVGRTAYRFTARGV